jgi:hypothetical protein
MDKPTLEQVRSEPAGHRLDEWVINYIHGWLTFWDENYSSETGRPFAVLKIIGADFAIWEVCREDGSWEYLSPSLDMTSAWQAAESLRPGKGWWVVLSKTDGMDSFGPYTCEFRCGDKTIEECGDTPALALCRAALILSLSL